MSLPGLYRLRVRPGPLPSFPQDTLGDRPQREVGLLCLTPDAGSPPTPRNTAPLLEGFPSLQLLVSMATWKGL